MFIICLNQANISNRVNAQTDIRLLQFSKTDIKEINTTHFLNLKVKVKVNSLNRVRLFATPWTEAHQASPSMGFSRQEYWSGLPFPSPGDLPDPGIEPRSPALQADALTSEPPGKRRDISVCIKQTPKTLRTLSQP